MLIIIIIIIIVKVIVIVIVIIIIIDRIIALLQKDTQEWTLIDVAVPGDQNIIKPEQEKVDRYQDPAFEIKRIHRASKVTMIPIVNGALGIISKNARSWHEKLKLPDIVGSAQLSAILGAVLRKVLCF